MLFFSKFGFKNTNMIFSLEILNVTKVIHKIFKAIFNNLEWWKIKLKENLRTSSLNA